MKLKCWCQALGLFQRLIIRKPYITRSLSLYTRFTNTIFEVVLSLDHLSSLNLMNGISTFRRFGIKYALIWHDYHKSFVQAFIFLFISKMPTISFLFLRCPSRRIASIQRINVTNEAIIVCPSLSRDCIILHWGVPKGRHNMKNLLIGLIEFLGDLIWRSSFHFVCHYSCIIYPSSRMICLTLDRHPLSRSHYSFNDT